MCNIQVSFVHVILSYFSSLLRNSASRLLGESPFQYGQSLSPGLGVIEGNPSCSIVKEADTAPKRTAVIDNQKHDA